MAFEFRDLDTRTRSCMLQELDWDEGRRSLYFGKRLSEAGLQRYPGMLRHAIESGDETSLALDLSGPGLLLTHEVAHTKAGEEYTKAVRHDANEVLAEGEFNRYYLRGLCRRAIEDGVSRLVVYRAKAVGVPRAESDAMVGTAIEVQSLLSDLREHPGTDTALGLPPGAGSGLSAHLP